LTRYLPPAEGPNVRVDTGVFEGGQISMYYDPMIAKLCTWGEDRAAAIVRMRRALDEYYIRGVTHNIPFLAALMAHPRFAMGQLTTNFIAEEYPQGFRPKYMVAKNPRLVIAVAGFVHRKQVEREASISGQLPGHEVKPANAWVAQLDGQNIPFTIQPAEEGYVLSVDGATLTVRSAWDIGRPLFEGVVEDGGEHHMVVQVDRRGIGYRLFHSGSQVDVTVLTPRAAELAALMPHKALPDLSKYLLSPMPGLLVSLAVAEGQEIKAGDVLAVIEAMKMENILRAERDGIIAKVHAIPGESLAVDQKILEFA
jgi:propionyl-CoA carboxylase alpha chain